MARYLGRNEFLNTKYIEFNSVAISVLWHELPRLCRGQIKVALVMAGKPGKRHNVCAHNAHDVFDWLNTFSLGAMSASAYTENVA